MTDNDKKLIAAIHAADIPPDLGGLYSKLKNRLSDCGFDLTEAMAIAHHFEAALIAARKARS